MHFVKNQKRWDICPAWWGIGKAFSPALGEKTNFVCMNNGNTILSLVKDHVQQAVPGAAVFLFGSRAYGNPTEESDWDILVLTRQPVTPQLKKNVHSAIFPISVQISAFINILILQESEWKNNPAYYSLHQSVDGRMIVV